MDKGLELLRKIVNRLYSDRVLSLALRAPVTEAKVMDFKGNVAAIRNGGTSTVLLNSGQWSLAPGESLHFGSQTDVNMINFPQVAITFDTSTGTVNWLQILEVGVKFC